MGKLAEFEVEKHELKGQLADCDSIRRRVIHEFNVHRNAGLRIQSQIAFTKTFQGVTKIVLWFRRLIDAAVVWRPGGILVAATALAGFIVILNSSYVSFLLIPIFFLIGLLVEWFLPDSHILSVIAFRTKRDYEEYRIWNDRMVPLQNRKSEINNKYRNLVERLQQVDSTIRRLNDESVTAERSDIPFEAHKRVSIQGVRVFGRGSECCYAYSFPNDMELAKLKGLSKHPVKVGMTSKSNPIERIVQQVDGSSTALSEKPNVLLVFYCKNALLLEQKLHNRLKLMDRKVAGSIGTEWFETNSIELIELFRDSV